jgi:Rrf2 family protein
MKLTAQEELGLRCMVQMAARPNEAATVTSIAQREALSEAYVGKLMRLLRDSGLVHSIRGKKGGYALSRPPEEICVREVLVALGGRLFTSELCHRVTSNGTCVHDDDCALRVLWSHLDALVFSLLDRCQLSHLARGGTALEVWITEQLRDLPGGAHS